MALTRDDIEAFARRIRPHFPEQLRDTAEELALLVAKRGGPRAKDLRPETPLTDFYRWIDEEGSSASDTGERSDSLDTVELVMALEEELQIEFSDEFARKRSLQTFADLVEFTWRQRQPRERRKAGS